MTQRSSRRSPLRRRLSRRRLGAWATMMQHAKVFRVHESMVVVVGTVVAGASGLVAQRSVAVRAVGVRELDIGRTLRSGAQRELARALIVDDDGRAMAAGGWLARRDTGLRSLGRVRAYSTISPRFSRGTSDMVRRGVQASTSCLEVLRSGD